MDCHIDWSTSKVEHGRLSVGLKPGPDFAFMIEFDRLVDPLEKPKHEGWGKVILAHGHVVVSDVRLDSAEELRTALDDIVGQANRLAVDTRAREQEQEAEQEAADASGVARQKAARSAAAEHDERLTDAFKRFA